jgi:hypothetical protein
MKMATRSLIGVKDNDGIRFIYCHFDGYPDRMLPILRTHFADIEKVEALIKLGDLKILGNGLEETIAFETNLNDKNIGAVKNEQEFLEAIGKIHADYGYLFDSDKNEWTMTR